ncbi:unnamed protein product [Arctia plantaginis]|uniref:Uncharacterized protein n=1 Tax=Arctia plantaginis TaxID=874455 RepID=A0A8S0ZKI8_ARCPL|nr:unnamed protein product [Arctia plantaginis]
MDVIEQVVCKTEPPESPPKKVRNEDYTTATYALLLDPYAAINYRALSAFRPWDKREPILQHPERVVRVADCASFERDYQPNVSLKPLTPPVDDVTSSTSPPPHSDSELAARLLDAEARLTERARLLDEREAELIRREARLDQREAEIARRERAIADAEPPLPNPLPPKEEAEPPPC